MDRQSRIVARPNGRDRDGSGTSSPEPTDPDIDLHVAGQRAELPREPWRVLGTIAAGGALGALARYGASVALPHDRTGFPWATFWVNVTGCLLLGLLMILISEMRPAHPLVRPFVGVGVLGGYTTFSAAVVDTQQLVGQGAARTALLYLLGTLGAAVLATLAGTMLGRAVLLGRRERGGRK